MHLRRLSKPAFRFSTALAIAGVAGLVNAAAAAGPSVNSLVNTAQPAPLGGTLVDNFSQNKQNEPSIAQNPLNAKNLIAGSNDEIDEPLCDTAGFTGCPFVANVGVSGVYMSTNGGKSWTQFSAPAGGANTGTFNPDGNIHTLPGFAALAKQLGIAGLASDGDPAIAFSRDGVAYYASLAGVRGTSAGDLLTVSRSTDGGASWSNPVLATNQTNPADFNDKDALWVDKSATSPNAGNVYVSWTLFLGPGFAEPIMFSRSTDGGRTFSPAVRLSASYNNNAIGGRQGSTIRTDAQGNIYVIWESGVTINGTLTDAQVFARSTDGGLTFSLPKVISPVRDLPSPLPGSSFRNDSFATADIDQASGAVYVAWADYQNGHGKVVVSKSTNGGANWSPASTALDVSGRTAFFPGIAVSPNATVSVATQALDDVKAGTAPGAGVVHYDSYFAKSTNGGASFTAPVVVSTATSDPDGSSTNALGTQFQGDYNTLIADNQHAWFIWTDGRNAAPCAAVDAFRAGTPSKPNPDAVCPATSSGQLFGNTDAFVGTIGL